VLDGNGMGQASFDLPAGVISPGTAGLVLDHAFLTLSGATVAFTSNAVSLTLIQ